MSSQESLFDFLDRLDPVPAWSARSERPSRIPRGPADLDLTKLSDAELTELLATLTSELQRRLAQGRGHRPELAVGIREAVQLLESLRPRAPKQEKRPRSRGEVPALQEGQRKAVRAALLAGVAPGQVARHFGLPLAAVREVLEHAA